MEELHNILKNNATIKEKIICIELKYYRDTHKSEVMQNPELFKINNISYEDQLVNLCALLADDENNQAANVILPSNNEVLSSLGLASSTPEEDTEIKIGQYYVTLFVEGHTNTWYIASCEGKNADGTYEMHHLTRCQRGSNLKWKQPSRIDRENILPASIVECLIDGEWDVSLERNMTFTLRNHNNISDLVKNIPSVVTE